MPGFRRVSEEELLRAWLFRVDRFHLLDPDGKPFDRFVIRHPGAVTVVPVHDDGTVTLVRQYRAAVDALVLEIPAGTCDKDGEAPEDTARRELAEEAGCEAARLGAARSGPGTRRGSATSTPLIYLATGLSPMPGPARGRGGGLHDGRDASTWTTSTTWWPTGTLKDETTVLGLYLARAPPAPDRRQVAT